MTPVCSVPGCDEPLNGALISSPELRRRALEVNVYCMSHQRLVNAFHHWLHDPAVGGFDIGRVGLVFPTRVDR
jgi:hypothetical protein